MNRKRNFRKYFLGVMLSSIFILLFLSGVEAGQKLTVSGIGWIQPVNSSNLISGAGSDLISTYQSAVNATILTISKCNSNHERWRVEVSRTDSFWDNVNLVISVLRTSDGVYAPGATISGGTSPVEVGASPKTFFSGSGDHSNITIQYQLSGMSVKTNPGLYCSAVTFTLVDIP
ncbi:MAG: hypothetical protein ACM3X9_01575 [Bacillota bacterium]